MDRDDRDPAIPHREPDGAAGHLKLPGARDRPPHDRELRRGLWPRAAFAGVVEHAGVWRRRRGARLPVRRAARLGDLAHRHAGEGLHPSDGVRRVYHPALSRRDRLDPARRPERRLAQQGVDGTDRRRARHFQCLLDGRADRCRRGHVVSLCVRIHLRRARSCLVRNGRRGEHSGRRHLAHHVPRHAAAGAARDRRRADHFVSRSDRAVRRARTDRTARTLSGRLDAALAVLRISGAGRAGRRLRDAAAADHAC